MRTYDEVIRSVFDTIDANRDEIIGLGRTIWKNPEAGYREVKTSALAAKTLSDLGLTPKTGFSMTGVRADLECAQPGPTVGILGEFDALVMPSHPECDPSNGAAHACGHNAITAGMLGAAIGLVKSGAAKDLAGKIAFIGCPAEECIELGFRDELIKQGKVNMLGGKASLIFDGVFDDVDMAYMNHSSSYGYYGAAEHNGFVMKIVTFHGKAAHAAGAPSISNNALSAANLALHALALLREKHCEDRSIRTHGIITSGGDSVNIIPDNVTLEYQLRADTVDKIKQLSPEFDTAITHCALALGCTADIKTFCGYMPLHDDQDIGKIYAETVNKYFNPDIKIGTLGFAAGSTDMGDISTIMPAFHGYCPGFEGNGHGVDYRVVDEDTAYVQSAKILAAMAVKLMYGDAAPAKTIAAKKASCMPISEYKKMVRTLEA